MKRRYRAGFGLVESLLVTGVVIIVLVFSLPKFVRLQIQAKESDAITSLGKISAAMEVYRILYKTYPDDLTNLSIVNPTLSSGPLLSAGSKGGYDFQVEPVSFTSHTYAVIAEPKVEGLTGNHKFKIDETGNMYRADALAGPLWSVYDSGGVSEDAGEGETEGPGY